MNDFSVSRRRLDLHHAALQAGFWSMFGSVCAYQAALLLARGLSNSDVGLIIAVRCLTGIIAQPLLGSFSDRHPNIPLKRIVVLSLALSFLVGLPFIFIPMGLGGTLAVFAFLGAFELSAYPLIDSMAIQFINAGIPIRYSLGRGIGSLAYALCCAALGMLTSRFGMELTLWVHAGLILLEILLVQTYPTYRPSPESLQKQQTGRPHSPLALLTHYPRFAMALAASFFGVMGVISLSNFLVNIVDHRGGGNMDLGLSLFLMGAFELPTAILFPKLLRRLGCDRLMCVSLGFCVLKCLAMLLAPSLPLLLACQAQQMLGYGLFTPTSVYFVNENIPAADQVLGQTLMMVASNGLGGVAGSFLMGRALDMGGVPFMLTLCLLCCGLGLVLGLLALRLPRNRP